MHEKKKFFFLSIKFIFIKYIQKLNFHKTKRKYSLLKLISKISFSFSKLTIFFRKKEFFFGSEINFY